MNKKTQLIVAIAGIFLLSACSSTYKTTPTDSPTPSITETPASLTCDSSHLAIQLGVQDAAMGSRGVTGMSFVNTSAKSCTLEGYPDLQMFDSSGKAVPTHVMHFGSFARPTATASLITLAPGAQAKFDLLYEAKTGYGNAYCPTSSKVAFTPPGSKVALTLDWKIQPYGGGSIQKLRCGEIKVSPLYLP
jgi:Protein of unknown function (DUF4232)